MVGLDQRMLDAFKNRDIEAVQALLHEGIDLNVISSNRTYLDWAWSGNKNIVLISLSCWLNTVQICMI